MEAYGERSADDIRRPREAIGNQVREIGGDDTDVDSIAMSAAYVVWVWTVNQLARSSPWWGDGWVLSWGFGLFTDYMSRRWVMPRSSKACRCSGVGVVSMVNAGMSWAG